MHVHTAAPGYYVLQISRNLPIMESNEQEAGLAKHRLLQRERARERCASESAEERESQLVRCRALDRERAREHRASESARLARRDRARHASQTTEARESRLQQLRINRQRR